MGWTKGKPRTRQTIVERAPTRKAPRMRMAADWNESTYDAASDSTDRLHIPVDVLKTLEQEDGVVLQWVTTSVRGQPEPQLRARFEKGLWRPVYADDFGGLFDGQFVPKGHTGEIEVDGLTLMARPANYSKKATERENRKAQDAVRIKEQSWRGGELGITGADHPSALASNRINRSMERIEIPRDE